MPSHTDFHLFRLKWFCFVPSTANRLMSIRLLLTMTHASISRAISLPHSLSLSQNDGQLNENGKMLNMFRMPYRQEQHLFRGFLTLKCSSVNSPIESDCYCARFIVSGLAFCMLFAAVVAYMCFPGGYRNDSNVILHLPKNVFIVSFVGCTTQKLE